MTFLFFRTNTCFGYFFIINLLFLKIRKKQPLAVNNYDFVSLTNESSCGLDVLIFDESRLYRFFINAFIYKHYVINSKWRISMHLQGQRNLSSCHFLRLVLDFHEWLVVYHRYPANELNKNFFNFFFQINAKRKSFTS